MGLIARRAEAAGMATTTVSLAKDLTAATGVPRAVFVRWPLGHPFGESGHPGQQERMVFEALRLLRADRPGTIAEPGFRWRREVYTATNWEEAAG